MNISDGETFTLQIRFDVRPNPAGDPKFFKPKEQLTPIFKLIHGVDAFLIGDQRKLLDRFLSVLNRF